MPLILGRIENQYEEEIVSQQYYLEGDSWYYEYINCYSSSELGLGSCRCVSHDPIRTVKVSREAVLEAIKENPTAVQELTEVEWKDLEEYKKNKEYELRCKFLEKLNMEPEEFKSYIVMLRDRLCFSDEDIKKMLKKVPEFARKYIEKELNLY